MLLVALTLLALRAAGPGFALGSVLAVAAIPGALLMPLGGWVSDRFSPAGVLLLCGVGRTLLASALASIVFLEVSSLWPLYALAVALGVLNALYYPASLSTVPAILKDKALLGAGSALVMGTQQVNEMAGPVLAASVVAFFGLGAVFGANALMFAAATILFSLVASGTRRTTQRALGEEAPSGKSSQQKRHELADPERPSQAFQGPVEGIVEGIRYAWRDPLLRTMLFALALLSFSTSGPLRVGGAMLAQTRLGGAEAFGILLSAFGWLADRAGARGFAHPDGTAGSRPHRGDGRARLGDRDSRLCLESVNGNRAGFGDGRRGGYLGVVLMAWMQERTKPSLHGRVMSLMMFAAVAVDPLSYALMGALSTLDLRIMFASAGSLLMLTALLGAASHMVRSFG